jgi:hypothetical protein
MHEDDLAGRLLSQQAAGGDRWEVVELPAIGLALWPEAYPIAALERIRLNTQPRFWSALYQQRPTPDTGDYFKADWLKPYDNRPARETLTVYGASDYAVTDDGGDYNDPVPVENPERQAVLMALEMRDAIGALTEQRRRLGHDISFGIGIEHGFATLGTIGFEGRFDYAAIGTVVMLLLVCVIRPCPAKS